MTAHPVTIREPIPLMDPIDLFYHGSFPAYNRILTPPVDYQALGRVSMLYWHDGGFLRSIDYMMGVQCQIGSRGQGFLSRFDLNRIITDLLTLGTGYFRKVRSSEGKVIGLKHQAAMLTWRAINGTDFYELDDQNTLQLVPADDIIPVFEKNLYSKHYGIPSYLSFLSVDWELNPLPIWRRELYQGDQKAGYIFCLGDIPEGALVEALQKSPYPGDKVNLGAFANPALGGSVTVAPFTAFISRKIGEDRFLDVYGDNHPALLIIKSDLLAMKEYRPRHGESDCPVNKALGCFGIERLPNLLDEIFAINQMFGRKILEAF